MDQYNRPARAARVVDVKVAVFEYAVVSGDLAHMDTSVGNASC